MPRNLVWITPKGQEIFYLPKVSRPTLGSTHPAPYWASGNAADHSPLASAKLKNLWSCTANLHYCFISWYL